MKYKIRGILDFDECLYHSLVSDVGTSMAYLSLSKAAGDRPLHYSAVFLAGYQTVNPLTPEELSVLHICQAARFTMSLVTGLHYHSLQPENAYFLLTQPGWPILEQLWKMDVVDLHEMWRDVAAECTLYRFDSLKRHLTNGTNSAQSPPAGLTFHGQIHYIET